MPSDAHSPSRLKKTAVPPPDGWQPDPAAPLPLQGQILEYMLERIGGGAWPAGMRLPSQRELSRRLRVDRSTVAAALGQLAERGLIETNRGGGTRVAAGPSAGGWNDYVEEGTHYPNLPAVQAINRLEFDRRLIRLGTGELHPDLLPDALLRRMLAELAQTPGLPLSYEEPLGAPALREAVSAELRASGIRADADSVLITSGALQGLQLIALGLLPRGSMLLLEKPSYLYSIHAFQSAGIKFSGLPLDEDGLSIRHLQAEAARHPAAALYTIPSFHNPTGAVMSAGRRRELMTLAARFRLPVLEDGAYQELWLDTPPPPPLMALDTEGRVLHLGTLSKTVSPGLRIGWIAGPKPVISRLADIKMQTDYGASSLSQLLAARWLSSGAHGEHLAELRSALRSRRDHALALLDRHFASIADWSVPAGGFYIWLQFHQPLSALRLFDAALEAGVLLHPGQLYDRGDSSRIRLSFAYATGAELELGLAALAATAKRLLTES